MNRLVERFEQLRAKNESALIAYVMAGDPDSLRSLEYMIASEAGGADMIILGFPSSDSIADGPAIQAASARSLQAKTTLKAFVQIIKEFRACSQSPLVLLSHYNSIWKIGEETFLKQISEAGADGVAIPDLPIEEATNWLNQCRKYHMSRIFSIVSETDEARIKRIAEQTTGFLNIAASLTSSNGTSGDFFNKTNALIERVKSLLPTGLPLVMSLDNATKESIQSLANAGVDGVTVTTALVEKIAQGILPETLAGFIRELKDGTRRISSAVS